MSSNSQNVPTIADQRGGPKLYNHDLAPTAPEGRTWGVFSLLAMWMSDVHSVGGYTFAASLFFLGLDRLAGADLHVGRHTGGLFPDEPDRASVAAVRHPVSGGRTHRVRRHGRQPRGRGPRRGRHRVVRRANLLRLQGSPGPHRHAGANGSRLDAQQHPRPVNARLVQFPFHVDLSARHFPQRHGADSPVHRLLWPGRLRGHVRDGDMDAVTDRVFQPVAATQPAGRLGHCDHGRDGERGDADRGLFRGIAAQFR